MKFYCTLFDSYYLSRGIVMIRSLFEHTNDCHLYVFAFDDQTYRILNHLKLDNTTIISLKEFETPLLLEVKKNRSKAEYSWTCTPAVIKHVFEKYRVQECTYIDADLRFYNDPIILLSELTPEKSTLITEHRYSFFEKIYEEKRAGRFCVQFITFNTLTESQDILNTWGNQCLDWCFNRYEDGKFGDQKYLDSWPHKYKDVHIMKNEGGGVAPWNIRKYRFSKVGKKINLRNRRTGVTFDLCFYHFQSLKMINNSTADLGWNYVNKKIRQIIYENYIEELIKTEKMLSESFDSYSTIFHSLSAKNLRERIKKNFKKITRYNIYKFNS